MATKRDRPYSQFNFLVSIDGAPGNAIPEAAFQEVQVEQQHSHYRHSPHSVQPPPVPRTVLFCAADVLALLG